MKSIKINSFILALVAALSVILLSTTALAQTDVNINNSNIVRFGGDVIVPPGQVLENVNAIGGDVTLQEGARVTQTAIAIGGNVILEQDARVDGDAYAVGGEIITSAGATIGGASGTVLENGRWGMHGRRRGTSSFVVRYLLNTAFHLINVLIGTIIGVVILMWRPNFLLNLAATINQYPLQSGLWGLGGLFAVILLVIILAVSLIGIPFLPLIGLMVGVTVVLGTLGVTLWVGERAASRERSPMQQFLIGVLILTLIGVIPVLGGLVLSVVNIFGFGALLLWLAKKQRLKAV
ncbi:MULTISPECIES: hypothetical protein [Calothrix]|uniref:DUF8173 domain-containing protein n=2 Tax=Calothrix TaxID=1186 RepID=A0ABR8AHP0_9CYAN|nr:MULTISPECIES: hypothetical protein [Calothrix]MBD2199536.1 hypothetical protein [Calothrix parietina FACHB-288]MBD2228311.1 hypothetical protein [Calothrix anomala FACHB-343]